MQKCAVGSGDVVATVADRPVDLAVVADDKAVHVVTAQRNAYAVTSRVLHLELGDTVAILIVQTPEVRDVGVEDLAVEREYARARSIERLVEGTGVERARFGISVAILVGQACNAIVVL